MAIISKIFEVRETRISRIERRSARQYIVDVDAKELQIAASLQAYDSTTIALTVGEPVVAFRQHYFSRSSNLFIRYTSDIVRSRQSVVNIVASVRRSCQWEDTFLRLGRHVMLRKVHGKERDDPELVRFVAQSRN